MKKNELEILSKNLNVSKSTIYKAINSQSGVKHETRLMISEYCKNNNLIEKTNKKCDIALILPDNPKYFWSKLLNGAKSAIINSDKPVYISIFSDLSRPEEFLLCLEEVKKREPKIYILAPMSSAIVQQKINELKKEKTVIFLSEKISCEYDAFIGQNPYNDGQILAKLYLINFSSFNKILMFGSCDQEIQKIRKLGFLDALKGSNAEIVGNLDVIYNGNKAYSAAIAREIYNNNLTDFNCFYCGDGCLDYTCLALQKLKMQDKVISIGYENPKRTQKYINEGKIAILLAQDTFKQGHTAIKLALEMLSGKNLSKKDYYIDSKAIISDFTQILQ